MVHSSVLPGFAEGAVELSHVRFTQKQTCAVHSCMSALGQKRTCGPSEPRPAQPMLAQPNVYWHHPLWADYRGYGHAIRYADPQRVTYSSRALVLGRQEMASSSRQSS